MPKIPSRFPDSKDTKYDRSELSRARSMHEHLLQNLDVYFQGSVERVVVTGSSANAFGQLWASALHQTAAAFAFVLPDAITWSQNNILHLIATLAAARAIKDELAIEVCIHWPKAVYAADQKVAEIFCDGLVHQTKDGKQILMVNVLFHVSALRKLKAIAEMKSIIQQKEWLLLGLINQFGGLVKHYLHEGFSDFLPEITPILYGVGKAVQVRDDQGDILSGRCLGINARGELLLSASKSGTLQIIKQGDMLIPAPVAEAETCCVP